MAGLLARGAQILASIGATGAVLWGRVITRGPMRVLDEACCIRSPPVRFRPRQSPWLSAPDAPRSRRRRRPHRGVEVARSSVAGDGGARARARAPVPRSSGDAEARGGAPA